MWFPFGRRVLPAPTTRELSLAGYAPPPWVTREAKLAGGKGNMVDFDANYAKRLAAHFAILMAYEDTSLAHDDDRVMLAIIFVRNHCEMLLGEMAPDIHARAEEKR